MPHGLIIGVTTSGKTHFGRALANGALAAGRGVIVLHKPREPWTFIPGPAPRYQTADPSKFIATVRAARSCFVFCEISDARNAYGVPLDKDDPRFLALATDVRHEGHECFFMAQRAVSIHATIRENCSRLYCFRVGLLTSKTLAEEFTDPTLFEATGIPLRWFYEKPDIDQAAALRPPINK